MNSYSPLLRQPLNAESLAENMEIPFWLFQNLIARSSVYRLKVVLYPSWAPCYTQMNSYVNTQTEEFLQ